ncbi:mechanosensitive ion channel family protein [Actinosynnema sp. CS-041913]|uniref:mechanosensitive ion channel family protein n=1 Tax=Actinosynnema sp. CS-041913 TaxID=3239917 RepID=UPI003D90F895
MGSQITDGLGQAWTMIATFVPKLLGFLLVLFIGWLIAKALAKAVGFLLKRVGFDRLVERSGLGGAMSRSPIDASNLIVKIVYYFVLLIALQLAFGVFGTGNAVSNLLNEVIAYLPRIVVAIILVLVAAAIGKALRGLVTGALGNRPYTRVLGGITYGFIVALGVIAALNQLGIAVSVTMPVLITVLATVAGVIVVGVGGGLVRPMQQRWEGWLRRMQEETAARTPAPRQSQDPATAPTAPAWASSRQSSMDQPTPPAGMPIPPTEGR